MRFQTFSMALLSILLATAASARDETDPYGDYRGPGDAGSDFRFDESLVEKWKEQHIDVPVLAEEGLRPLRIDHGPPGLKFFIDVDTLSVNADDYVVRYWLVTETSGQRSNVLYEGLLCNEQKFKTYAYASPRRTSLVKFASSTEWENIRGMGSDDFHYELAEDYFCSLGSPRSVIGIRDAVAGRRGATSHNYGDADFVRP